MFSWRTIAAVTLAVTVSALTMTANLGCGGGDEGGGGAGSKGGNKTLTVGTEPNFPPFESRDAKGEFVGFDVDLVRAVGEKAGYTVQFKDLGFDALIPALNSGQIDMIASGMSITDERKNVVTFSDPYIEAGLALAVRGNERAVKGKGDLKGKTVAVQQGSTGATAAEEMKKEGAVANIKYYPTVPLAMMELTKGGADAVINDRPTSEAYVAQAGGGQIKVLPELLKSDSYGLAMKKGNTELAAKVNAALSELKAAGFVTELEKKHFAASATATTAPATQPTAGAQ